MARQFVPGYTIITPLKDSSLGTTKYIITPKYNTWKISRYLETNELPKSRPQIAWFDEAGELSA